MIRGHHDGNEHRAGVQQPEPSDGPAATSSQRPRQQHRISEVQRWHGRIRVGYSRQRRAVLVDRRTEALECVDHSRRANEPRWGQRKRQMDHERHEGDRNQSASQPSVGHRIGHEQEQQDGRGRHQVDAGVEPVQRLDDGGRAQCERLEIGFDPEADPLFEVDDTTGVDERRSGIVAYEKSNNLVEKKDAEDDGQLDRSAEPTPFTRWQVRSRHGCEWTSSNAHTAPRIVYAV